LKAAFPVFLSDGIGESIQGCEDGLIQHTIQNAGSRTSTLRLGIIPARSIFGLAAPAIGPDAEKIVRLGPQGLGDWHERSA